MPPLIAEEDYYFDTFGRMVFTEAYHLKRGYCCGNKCRHCPYDHENVPGKKKEKTSRPKDGEKRN